MVRFVGWFVCWVVGVFLFVLGVLCLVCLQWVCVNFDGCVFNWCCGLFGFGSL